MANGFIDDINDLGEVVLHPLSLENDELYFVKSGYELVGLLDGITEDSNPVISCVQLKK